MAVLLKYTLPGAKIDDITLDATVMEQHSSRGDITDFPVEEGTDISDHKRVLPDRLRIEGVVSNTPLPSQTPSPATFVNDSEAGVYRQRAETAYETLLAIHEAGIPITIYTPLRTYERMELESLEVPRSAEIGDAVRFMAEFKQIRTVASQTVTVVKTSGLNSGRKKHDKGIQPKKPVETEQADKPNSVIRSLKEKIIGGDNPASMYPGVLP